MHLESVLDHPIALLTAPAGFGKTWAVADWLASHADLAQCWVTVDRYDRDPMRLWLHVIRAVNDSGAAAAATEALRLLETTGAGVPLIVDTLAGGLAEQAEEMIIVLDDIHLLEGDESMASLDQFLGLLPRGGHVVLAGRHDPVLPLAKWRLAGDLVEIRTIDLRCSLEESQAVVSESMGLDLDAAVVADIQHKTMGWMAGIRLAATAAASSTDASATTARLPAVGTISGAYDAVGDYLVEEALDDIAEDDRRFLLDTSILNDLSGPLCAAVSGRADSGRVLERLAESGMFISRIDDWFRYHDLFRDTLRVLLHRRSPDRERELHHRAAEWLHDHGDAIEAIRHAVKSEDPDLAAEWLIESSRMMLEAKQFDTLCTLFTEVDDALEAPAPNFLAAWCFPVLYTNSGIPDIDRVHEQASRSLNSMTETDERRLRTEWLKLPEPYESSTELLRGIDATLAHRRGDVALALSTLRGQGDTPSASGWLEASAGEMLIYTGRYAEGLELMQPWADFAFSSRNPVVGNKAYTLTSFAWAKLGEGKLAQAESLAAQAIDTLRSNGLADGPQAAVATVPLAWVAWERGDLETADKLITPVLDRVGHYGEIPAYVFAYALVARLRWAEGDRSAAHAALNTARLLPSGRPATGLFADRLAVERARLALLNNDLAGAEVALPDWQERINGGAADMAEHIVLTRLTIASGTDAATLLATTPDGLEVTAATAIEVHKLNAYAALKNNNATTALDHLIAAMETAGHTGHRQTFLDDYPTFGALIENAAAMAGLHLLDHRQFTNPPQPDPGSTPSLTEPLTGREIEVLRLLPSHLTYREIGEQLYVSTNTVKSYVKNIYRKLEADRRTKAVAIARTLGLVN